MRAMFASGRAFAVVTPKGIARRQLDDYIAKSGPILEKEGFTEQRARAPHRKICGNLADGLVVL